MAFFSDLLSPTLRLSGLPWILRHTQQKNKATILLFHQPEPSFFDKAITILKKRYNIIPFSFFLESLKNKTIKLPERSIIITFDDGRSENFHLLPVLEKHKITATIFLISGIADTMQHPWFYAVKDRQLKESMKKMSDSARLAALKRYGFEEDQIFENRIMLNKEEIQSMQKSGLVEFGAHTLSHPILPKCSDSKAAKEIQLSKITTEILTHHPCSVLSFPNGEYSERDIRICKKAGYEAAITLDTGYNTRNTDPFRLKRISVPDSGTISELLVKASGAWAFFKVLAGKQKRTRRHSGL